MIGLLAVALAAQLADRPASATGSGAIAGTVITDDESARPVRSATVTLTSSNSLMRRTTVTGDDGRFAFVNLPPARYSLAASRPGWIAASYGAKAAGRPGRALQLAEGGRATATLRIARGAVISGTILDQFGQPVGGAALRVLKYGYSVNTGDRRLNMVAVSSSGPDERGSYRIYGLAPGEYYVSAVNANAAMPGGLDLHLTSDVDVQDALKPGASGTGTAMPEVPQPNVGYGQVFYPGAASVAQATPIAVRAGEERPGVDFTIQYSPAARVEGTLLSPAGGPSAGHLHLTGYDSSGNMVAIGDTPRTQAGADGRFSFADVPPGPYVLSAHEVVSGSAGERPQIAYAMTDLDVRSELVSGLSLTLQDAFTVSGTIRYDGDGPPPDFRDLRVILTRAQIDGSVTVATGRPTTTADGRFTVDGVAPGRYLLRVNQPPLSRLALRSATILGQDAADAGADVRQTVSDSVITMTDRVSELTGRIESPAGAAAADYAMLLFSSDRAHWRSQSRRVLAMRLANDGSFAFRNVPPGDYLLAAVDDVEPGEWFDPAFLQRLAPAAIRVTIGDGEKKVQDVRLGGR